MSANLDIVLAVLKDIFITILPLIEIIVLAILLSLVILYIV